MISLIYEAIHKRIYSHRYLYIHLLDEVLSFSSFRSNLTHILLD